MMSLSLIWQDLYPKLIIMDLESIIIMRDLFHKYNRQLIIQLILHLRKHRWWSVTVCKPSLTLYFRN